MTQEYPIFAYKRFCRLDLVLKRNTIYAMQCQVITCTKLFDRILIVFDQKTYNFAIKWSSIAPIKRSLFNFLA